MPQETERRLEFWEEWLSLWIALCVGAGIGLGKVSPQISDVLGEPTVADISIPVAVLSVPNGLSHNATDIFHRSSKGSQNSKGDDHHLRCQSGQLKPILAVLWHRFLRLLDLICCLDRQDVKK